VLAGSCGSCGSGLAAVSDGVAEAASILDEFRRLGRRSYRTSIQSTMLELALAAR